MNNIVRLLGLENPLKPLRREAEAGDPESQFLMGEVYLHGGYALPRDYEEAVKWYRKAADQNHPESQAKLGSLYWSGGCGLEEDWKEAEKWYRRAEQNGHHEAIVCISLLHDRSSSPKHCLPPLPAQELYALNKKGAELNLPHCQSTLADLYYEGKVVPKNLVHAHAWYTLASENKREVWAHRWNELVSQMSATDKEQAAQVAKQLRSYIANNLETTISKKRDERATKAWLRKCLDGERRNKAPGLEAECIQEQARRVEIRRRNLAHAGFGSVSLIAYIPAALFVYKLFVEQRDISGFYPLLLAIAFLVFHLWLTAKIAWRFYDKPRLVEEYLEIFRRVGMPPRLYCVDRSSAYIDRILDGGGGYEKGELSSKAFNEAKKLAEEAGWRGKLRGGSDVDTFWSVIDEVLDVFSPADDAPPLTFGPIHEWVNETTFKDLSKIGHVSEDMCKKVIAERPFSSNREFYLFLKRQNLTSLTVAYFYMGVNSASEKWIKEKQES